MLFLFKLSGKSNNLLYFRIFVLKHCFSYRTSEATCDIFFARTLLEQISSSLWNIPINGFFQSSCLCGCNSTLCIYTNGSSITPTNLGIPYLVGLSPFSIFHQNTSLFVEIHYLSYPTKTSTFDILFNLTRVEIKLN